MIRVISKRRRGSRRKGERSVAVLGTAGVLLGTLDRLRVDVELRERAVQIAEASSGWVG